MTPKPKTLIEVLGPQMTEAEALALAIEVTVRHAEARDLLPRRREALMALRGYGWSFQRIADAIGTSKTAVHAIINPPKGKS